MTRYFDDESSRGTAVDYLRSQLRQGKTLAAFLLSGVNFQQGRIATLTHTALTMKEALEFGQGHESPAQDSMRKLTVGRISGVACPKPSANKQLVEMIEEVLGQGDSICVLENSLAEPGDLWLKGAKSRVAIYDSEVYHFLMPVDRNETSVTDSIREASGPTNLVGALGRAPVGINFSSSRRFALDRKDLEECARLSQCVFVSAYDGEGYIVWSAGR
jgi:hypothetical protein